MLFTHFFAPGRRGWQLLGFGWLLLRAGLVAAQPGTPPPDRVALDPRPGSAEPVLDTAAVLPNAPRRLADFVAVAQRNSPLLADLANQVRQNRLDSLRRAAQNGVQLNGIGAAVAYPTLTGPGGEARLGYDAAITNGGNYVALAQATKPVFNHQQLAVDYRILESQGLVLRNTRRLSALDVRRTIIDQFLTAYAAQSQWQFSQGLLTELRRQDDVLHRLVEGGVFKQTQYLSFYLSVRTQEVTAEQNQLAYRRELGNLRALAGVADTALVELAAPAPPAPRPLAGLAAPAQQQYTLDSLRLHLDRQAVAAAYRPKVSLVADAGWQSASYRPAALGRSTGLSGGLLLTLPIFDGHQRQLQLQRIDFGERSRQQYRTFLTTQRRQQYAQLRQQVRAADALLARISEQLRVAEALVGATRQQLATGEALILDYLTVLTSYRTLQFSQTQAETDRLRSLYALDLLSF